MLVLAFRGLGDRLAISHLRPANVGLHAEFAHHAIHDDFKMQLAHAFNQHLTGVMVRVDTERRIFLGKLSQRGAHFFLVNFGLGLDRYRNDGRGKIDVFENDWFFFVTQRIAGRYVLQTHASRDVARFNRFNFFALVRMHPQEAAHALAHFSGGIENRLPGLQHT